MADALEAFSPRERAIVAGVKDGLSTREIAQQLEVSAAAVELDFVNIRRRLGKNDRPDPLEALTPRERAIVTDVREGLTASEIALKLAVSVRSIESAFANIRFKLEAS